MAVDEFERRFRKYNGDELTDLILLRTSQLFDRPFWVRESQACHDDPEIAYKVAMSLEEAKSATLEI